MRCCASCCTFLLPTREACCLKFLYALFRLKRALCSHTSFTCRTSVSATLPYQSRGMEIVRAPAATHACAFFYRHLHAPLPPCVRNAGYLFSHQPRAQHAAAKSGGMVGGVDVCGVNMVASNIGIEHRGMGAGINRDVNERRRSSL